MYFVCVLKDKKYWEYYVSILVILLTINSFFRWKFLHILKICNILDKNFTNRVAKSLFKAIEVHKELNELELVLSIFNLFLDHSLLGYTNISD